jgi:hypothetical protein
MENKGYWTEGKIVDGVNVGGGKFVQGTAPVVAPLPTVNTTINGSALGSASPTIVPTTTPTMTTSPTVAAPTGTTVDANGSAVVAPPTNNPAPERSTYQKLIEKMGGLGDILSTKADVTKKEQENAQLAQKTEKATQSYNTYNKAKLELQQQIEDEYTKTGGTTGGVSSSVQAMTRAGNANLANLAIQAQADQGLLSAAEKTIKDKIEAQFAPIQEQIEYFTKFAALNANDLTESEKFQLAEKANAKKTELASVNNTSEDIHKTLLQNGAPSSAFSALDKISNDYVNGKITSSEAQNLMYKAASPYGVNLLDKQFKQAQIDKIRTELSESGKGGVDAANILAYAQQYASTGTIPTGLPKGTFGIVANAARDLPKVPGTIIDVNTGVKPNIADAKIDGLAALYDLTNKLDELDERFSDIVPGVIGGIAGTLSGSDDLNSYLSLKGEIVDLIARARSGAALTADEQKFYESRLPTRFSNSFFAGTSGNKQISEFKKQISDTLKTKLKANGVTIVGMDGEGKAANFDE